MSKIYIYIVDDNPLLRLLAKNTIKAWLKNLSVSDAVTIMTCSDGKEAIDAFQNIDEAGKTGDNYYIVLMDYNMPNMTGLDAAKSIMDIIHRDSTFKAHLQILGFSITYAEILDENTENEKYKKLRPDVLEIFHHFLSKEPIKQAQWEETLSTVIAEMGLKISKSTGFRI